MRCPTFALGARVPPLWLAVGITDAPLQCAGNRFTQGTYIQAGGNLTSGGSGRITLPSCSSSGSCGPRSAYIGPRRRLWFRGGWSVWLRVLTSKQLLHQERQLLYLSVSSCTFFTDTSYFQLKMF